MMSKIEPKRGRPKKYKKSSAFRSVRMVLFPGASAVIMNRESQKIVTPESKVKNLRMEWFS